jgi:hypothetical protein
MILRPTWEDVSVAARGHGSAGPDELARPHAAAFVAIRDAPLTDESAASCGRRAMESGDGHASAKKGSGPPGGAKIATPAANDATRDAQGRR